MIPHHARRLLTVAAFSCLAGPLGADDGPFPAGDSGLKAEFLGRIRALNAPSAPIDLYSDERQADLDGIARQDDLFDPSSPGFGPEGGPSIALFIGPNCPDCDVALSELRQISQDLGIRVAVLDTTTTDNAAAMAALGLDILPSYVMHDRLIRGHMPAFVLHRYLTDTGG